MFSQGSIPVIEKLMAFSYERQKVIANNIANISTPNYKAQDLPVNEFQQMLMDSISKKNDNPIKPLEFAGTSNIDASDVNGIINFNVIDSPNPGALKEDGNNVDPDKEGVKMTENAIVFNFMRQLLKYKYQMIKDAISIRR